MAVGVVVMVGLLVLRGRMSVQQYADFIASYWLDRTTPTFAEDHCYRVQAATLPPMRASAYGFAGDMIRIVVALAATVGPSWRGAVVPIGT